MISKSTIEKVYQASDIVEVIGSFVCLKKSGSGYVGLSPFSQEKTPSFNVHPGKNIFKDFSSGKGGSVIDFLMEHERITYPEAIRWLADRYKIEVEETGKREKVDTSARDAEFMELNRRQSIFTSSFEGSAAEQYFFARGFTRAVCVDFGVGYCPDELQDQQRGRITFPIHNVSGKIVSFGGRILTEEKNRPKYLNGPESAVYQKSKTLYNLNRAKNAIIKLGYVYLVEGYTDVMAMDMHGLCNSVASCVTGLTDDQLSALHRFASEIVIVYDGDSAGIKAALNGIELALREGFLVKLLALPGDADPDSFLMANGKSEFDKLEPVDFVQYRLATLGGHAKKDRTAQAKCVAAICRTISLVKEPILRELYAQDVCAEFGLSRSMLNDMLLMEAEVPALVVESKMPYDAIEAELIALLLDFHSVEFTITMSSGAREVVTLLQYVVESLYSDEVALQDADLMYVLDQFKDHYEADMPIERWRMLSDERIASVSRIVSTTTEHISVNAADVKRIAVDYVHHIKMRFVNMEIEAVDQTISMESDMGKVSELLAHKRNLIAVRAEIAKLSGRVVF